MMNIKQIAVSLIATGLLCSVNATSVPNTDTEVKAAIQKVLTKPSPKVQALIEKFKVEMVDTPYVNSKLGKGTRVSAKSVLIDARPPKKYAVGHVPTAINIPDTKFEDFYNQIADLNKSTELITYCGGWKCAKSPKLAGMLQAKGFTNVKSYQSGYPSWKKAGHYLEVSTVAVKSAVKKSNAVIIDARPVKKFAASRIKGAINIPDTKMDSMLDKFPTDKAQKVITYCGGFKCAKSHKIAKKLVSMDYKNVAVYAAGLPAWEKAGLEIEGKKAEKAAAAKTATKEYIEKNGIQLVADQEENQGMVYGPWYLETIKKLPENFVLVDVREADDYASGHIPGSINIPFDDKAQKAFSDKVRALNKIVILNCAAGAMATESMVAVIDNGGDLDKVFYVDANLDCNKKNECTIEINEPL